MIKIQNSRAVKGGRLKIDCICFVSSNLTSGIGEHGYGEHGYGEHGYWEHGYGGDGLRLMGSLQNDSG